MQECREPTESSPKRKRARVQSEVIPTSARVESQEPLEATQGVSENSCLTGNSKNPSLRKDKPEAGLSASAMNVQVLSASSRVQDSIKKYMIPQRKGKSEGPGLNG